VTLRGRTYSLNGNQAAAIRMLHEAYENGTPELGQYTILEQLELRATRLRSVSPRGWLGGTDRRREDEGQRPAQSLSAVGILSGTSKMVTYVPLGPPTLPLPRLRSL